MSQKPKTVDRSIETETADTPPSKHTQVVCPPAPVKGELVQNTEISQRASLTRSQALELRKSWKNLSDEIFKE